MGSVDAGRTTARRDLVWIIVATVVVAILCARFELSETVVDWTRPHEQFQLDELPVVLLFLALALAWHAWRRVGEVRAELQLRRGIEARLREALLENRELAQASVRIQEEERRILARELHDEFGQYLNAIKIDAVCIRDASGGRTAELHDGAVSIIGMTDHMQVLVRDIVRRLRPPGLDELGLPAALENYVDGWRRRLPSVEFKVAVSEDLGELDEATNMTLYRLVQEGLTNVARHAHASRVEILMKQQATDPAGDSEVVLTMHDNGVGNRKAPSSAGLGLIGMRERVEALAGRFDVMSTHGGGFGFTARIPVQRAVA